MKKPKSEMLKKSALGAAASALAILSIPQVAQAGPAASVSYKVRAHVPVACWVKPVTPMISELGASGQVVEACNSPGGFTVQAHYRTLVGNEKAKLRYGSDSLMLDKGGSQVLRRASMATIRTVDYRFEEVELEQPLVLSLTIQPI